MRKQSIRSKTINMIFVLAFLLGGPVLISLSAIARTLMTSAWINPALRVATEVVR